jgi:hypothetical protein
MFWTPGSKQVGKAGVPGWTLLAASPEEIRYWPFDGSLVSLLTSAGPSSWQTYSREFYRLVAPPPPPPVLWS